MRSSPRSYDGGSRWPQGDRCEQSYCAGIARPPRRSREELILDLGGTYHENFDMREINWKYNPFAEETERRFIEFKACCSEGGEVISVDLATGQTLCASHSL